MSNTYTLQFRLLLLYIFFVILSISMLLNPQIALGASKVPVTIQSSSSSEIVITTPYMRTWQKSNGRFGLALNNPDTYMFLAQDYALLNLIFSGGFPSSSRPSYAQFSTAGSLVSFGTNSKNEIEHVRNINGFRVTQRSSLVNTTVTGAYMKQEVEITNNNTTAKPIGASFNIDTAIAGNDKSDFKIVENGWIGYSGNVQAYAFYNNMGHVTSADAIFLGYYASQSPKSPSSYTVGSTLTPGDSGAGFYYNLKTLQPGETRKESFIMGLGPRNNMPTLSLTSPAAGTPSYAPGQTLKIIGTANDADTSDELEVLASLDNGTEFPIKTIAPPATNKSFETTYTIPTDISPGTHVLKIWVLDDNGGSSAAISRTFTVESLKAPTYTNITSTGFTANITSGMPSSTTFELYDVVNYRTISLSTSKTKDFTTTPNTKHTYKFRAKYAGDTAYSEYSPQSTVYSLANAPTKVSLDSSTATQASVTWGANSNPTNTNYVVELRDKATGAVLQTKTTTALSHTFTSVPVNKHLSVYAKAINTAGISTVYTHLGDFYRDTVLPTMTTSVSTTAWTTGDVMISVTASDDYSGIATITKPDNTKVTTSPFTYTVTSNGTYTFVAEDGQGNKTTKTVTITNIDKTPPATPTITLDTTDWTFHPLGFTVSSNGDGTGSGVKTVRYRIAGGAWTNYTSKVTIPTNLSGQIKVEAQAIDNVGNESAIQLVYGKIDNVAPTINSFKIENANDLKSKAVVAASDAETGVDRYRYWTRVIGVDSELSLATTWVKSSFYEMPTAPVSTLHAVKADVRDGNNNQSTTSTLYYISPPDFSFSGIKSADFANTATFELKNPVGENVEVLIYRGDEYAGKIRSGETTFIDKNLDYERKYVYTFTAKTVNDSLYGQVNSRTNEITITVGKPQLEMSIDNLQSKTLFNDDFTVSGKVTYLKGGTITLDVYRQSETANPVTSGEVEVHPTASVKWKLAGEQEANTTVKYRLDANVLGYEDTDMFKRSYEFTIDTISPIKETLNSGTALHNAIYSSK